MNSFAEKTSDFLQYLTKKFIMPAQLLHTQQQDTKKKSECGDERAKSGSGKSQ